ncbi:hypothetical protein BaRGS_00003688 [Batillaria attramentaria]|uniref:Uncharacterized protein n=1 Tax=Batillaria attramentaria TaxID=370345 RepID=A0ABD0M077_9CAEN
MDSICRTCSSFCPLLLLLLVTTTSASMQCKDMNGKPVDWFIVYKLPKMRHETGTRFGDGLAQFYLDGQAPQWSLSKRAVNETDHAIYYTLQQVYEAQPDSILYLMYNDEKPDGGESLSHGHTKGVVGFDSKSGFWLIHSAPMFPPKQKDGYEWADNASDYGQMFFCVSFGYSESLGVLAKQLLYNYPQVYDHNLPASALKDFPLLADLVNSTRINQPPYHSIQHLSSLGGLPLTSFAKFTYFGADLYDNLVAPYLKVPLLVETWQHGDECDVLHTNCSTQYEVYNIVETTLPGNFFFSEFKDHSKYAISLTGQWVCVGDINRERSQFKRGGGTLCFQDGRVWRAYDQIITFFQPCPPPK